MTKRTQHTVEPRSLQSLVNGHGFTLSQIAKEIGCNPETLATHLDRGTIPKIYEIACEALVRRQGSGTGTANMIVSLPATKTRTLQDIVQALGGQTLELPTLN